MRQQRQMFDLITVNTEIILHKRLKLEKAVLEIFFLHIYKIPNHSLVFKGFLNKASADVQGKSGTLLQFLIGHTSPIQLQYNYN